MWIKTDRKIHRVFRNFNVQLNVLCFAQNEEIFVQLDELDELDKITHA